MIARMSTAALEVEASRMEAQAQTGDEYGRAYCRRVAREMRDELERRRSAELLDRFGNDDEP